MGHLINGIWKSGDVITSNDRGEFEREASTYHHKIEKGGEFEPEENRYHLYVSFACPWAHRTLITRALKNLEKIITVDIVSPDMLEHSWSFDADYPEATKDRVNGKKYLYEIYKLDKEDNTCKVTVPVLWDKKSNKIVNNESSEIIRILNTAFDEITGSHLDLYPKELQAEIDKWNDFIYEPINNGVYKTGFAQTQNAYEQSLEILFQHLEELESHLEGKHFLVGDRITEADIRLITTLLRFDCVYHGHFKCNLKRMVDYKNLKLYIQNLYAMEQINKTTNFNHIKRHYYYSHDFLNPTRVVPVGPKLDYLELK